MPYPPLWKDSTGSHFMKLAPISYAPPWVLAVLAQPYFEHDLKFSRVDSDLDSRGCCILESLCRPQSTVRRHRTAGDWCKSDFSIAPLRRMACCTHPIPTSRSNPHQLRKATRKALFIMRWYHITRMNRRLNARGFYCPFYGRIANDSADGSVHDKGLNEKPQAPGVLNNRPIKEWEAFVSQSRPRKFINSDAYCLETHRDHSYFTWNHARCRATVSQTTVRRLDQFVNEESSRTLTNLDVVVPITALAAPVITHFTRHNAFSQSRMFTLHPAGRVGTAAVHRNAGSRHTSSRCASESIPSGLWHGTLIAALIHRIRVQPGLVIQGRVRGAFRTN